MTTAASGETAQQTQQIHGTLSVEGVQTCCCLLWYRTTTRARQAAVKLGMFFLC
jgi:hypothetical protein